MCQKNINNLTFKNHKIGRKFQKIDSRVLTVTPKALDGFDVEPVLYLRWELLPKTKLNLN